MPSEHDLAAHHNVSRITIRRALERLEHRITVPAHIADRARQAIERMVAIGSGAAPRTVAETPADPGE